MKITGQINIGIPIIQVDKINKDFSLKAPVGAFLYSDPLNVLTKKGKKDTDWTRSTFRVMMMNILSWAVTMLDAEESDRKEVVDLVYKSIETFKKGETSKEGREAVKFLKEDCKLIGFIPQVAYIMPKARGEDSLNCFWEHPFSIPTLLLKHKKLPFLIISNGNLDFDDSRLKKMTDLSEIEIEDEKPEDTEVEFEEDDIQGITG